MKEHRQLAAIMFTDIAGYSALMSKDEKVTLQNLSRNRELHKAALKRFNGEFIKEMGDGILSIFKSSWEAVCCAMEMQSVLNEEAYFQLHIGINIGDIVITEKDVFGDGVNIAARLQALCEPGSILFSEAVFNDIRNKPGIRADCLGERQLKNIDQPIRIYSISPESILQWKERSMEKEPARAVRLKAIIGKGGFKNAKRVLLAGILSLVVLVAVFFAVRPYLLNASTDAERIPIAVISFENQTGDTTFNYLQKAIPNLLITNLEQSRLFRVMTWERMQDVIRQLGRENAKTIDADLGFEICSREGCRFIVIGSYVKAGEVFATDVKVLDVESKQIVNSVNAKGKNVGSILSNQIDDLSKAISHSLGISSQKIETARMHIQDVTTNSLDAYNYFLKGRDALDDYYWDEARQYLEKAVSIDPGFAMAYLYLSKTYGQQQLADIQKRDEALEKAWLASKRATEIEQLAINANYAGIIQQDARREYDLLQQLKEKAPRDKRVWFQLGQWYNANGNPDQAIEAYKESLQLDPDFGEADNQLAYLYLNKGEYAIALEYLKKYSALNPKEANPYDSMGDLLWRMGNPDEAITAFENALECKPDFWPSAAKMSYVYAMKENYPLTVTWQEKALDLSNSQGIQAHTYWDMAFTDYLYGKKDHALEMLGRSKEAANKTNNSLFDIGFYYLQAYFYLDLGQYGKARELYHTFMNIALTEPSTTPQDDSTGFYLFRGLVQIQLNRLDSAAMNVERIKAQSSDQATVWNWQYLVREIQIASAEGQEDLDKIALLEQPVPNFQSPWVLVYNLPYMRNSLAEAYHRFGLTDKAIAEYERMITFDPASNDRHLINPRYHYYLGILYQEKEMKEKAAEQFRKFLYLWQDADDVFPEPADALQRLKSMEEGKS